MYYYIMETAGKKESELEKIKDILGDLGIAGETVSPSPARTIEELASLGIVKGYSTIVAVGSERIVNKVVTALINQTINKEVALGVIPDNFSSNLSKQIGVENQKDACVALKLRKLQTIDACEVAPNKYFLTEATIEVNRGTDVYMTLDSTQAGMPFRRITIKPGLQIEVEDWGEKSSFFFKLINKILKKPVETKDIFSSFFKTNTVRFDGPNGTLSLKADGEIIAKTPIVCRNLPKALKIITRRDMLITKETS